jgi:ribosome-interacting GTPase 1
MSSNLSAEAKIAYQAYMDANGLDERIEKLRIFLSVVPKHKASEKIVALNKTKLSKLIEEKEQKIKQIKSIASAVEDPFTFKHEPDTIQLVMISDFFEHFGVGKTTLLQNLSGGLKNAKPGIFTAEPLLGIFEWEHVKFQLVEEPALHQSQFLNRIIGGVRRADILALVIDLSRDPVSQIENIHSILDNYHIYLNRNPPQVKIERTGSGGIQIFFLSKEAKECEYLSDFIKDMVKAWGTVNASVKIYEKVSIEEIEIAFSQGASFKAAIIIASKADLSNTKENYKKLISYLKKSNKLKIEIYPVAITYNQEGEEIRKGLDSLAQDILKKLNLIRIFTKSSKGIAVKPLVLPKDSTVGDVAKNIHKDLFETFKFAYIFREVEGEFTKQELILRLMILM